MPGSAESELIFIAAMMVLILVISFVAVFFFVKTYRKEMAAKREREAASPKPETGNSAVRETASKKEGESGIAS